MFKLLTCSEGVFRRVADFFVVNVRNPHDVIRAAVQSIQAHVFVQPKRGGVVKSSPVDGPVRYPNGRQGVATWRVVPSYRNRRGRDVARGKLHWGDIW